MTAHSLANRFKQNAMAWLANLFGILLITLTILYAGGSYSMANFNAIRSSSANTILVLRVLTEITSILLTLNLNFALENIKWRLVTRTKGLKLPDFLCLVPGTSLLGLSQLLFSKGSTWASWRFWSLGRLVFLALLPILNVIIFSDIGTHQAYHIETTVTGPFGGVMGDFNASRASGYTKMIDSLIGPAYADFLSDSRRIIDITPAGKDVVSCSSGTSKISKQTCEQTFFLPGTVTDLAQLSNTAAPQADMFVLHDAPGYMLNFTTNQDTATFDPKSDCRVYGEEFMQFELCAIGHKGSVEMRLNACGDMKDLRKSHCFADGKWRNLPGPSVKAQISVRNATIGFSRLNSTVLTYQLTNSWFPLNINGADILAAFDGFFLGKRDSAAESKESDILKDVMADLLSSVSNTSSFKYAPISVASWIAMSYLYGEDAATARKIHATQALLAIALHYCSGLSGVAVSSVENLSLDGSLATKEILKNITTSFSDVTYSLASSSYELVVGPTSIYVYFVLGGLLLLINLVVLCICTLTDTQLKRPETTAFADLDHRRLTIDVPGESTWRGPTWDQVGRVEMLRI